MIVRVLADDLTGALDSGACFAPRLGALPVSWQSPAGAAWDGVLDTETRDLSESDALAGLLAHLPELAGADLAFKKIDSLMRGNSMAEIAACARSPGFRSVVVAPAFPAQRRITRNGQQLARTDDGAPWAGVGPNLLAELDGGVTHVRRGQSPRGCGTFVCDAETQDDLAVIADSRQAIDAPVLWCGTAGLARALAGEAKPCPVPSFARIFVVVGSRQPVAMQQVAQVRARWPDAVVGVGPSSSIYEVRLRLRQALHGSGLALLIPDYPREQADARLASLLTGISEAIAPDLCIATGGTTLRILLDSIGCSGLAVEGEIEPGIAFSRLRDGGWASAALVSKSGAFGEAATISRLIDISRCEPGQ